MLKRNELRPDLQRRIAEAVAHDDTQTAEARRNRGARIPRLPAAEPQSESRPPLRGRDKGKTGSAPGTDERYRIIFYIFACQPTDWDNAPGGIKRLQDMMVEAGYLPDDNWRVLEGEARPVKVAHKHEQKVIAVLTRLQ